MKQITAQFPACPLSLSSDQVEQYWRDGYITFLDVLTGEEVETARSALSELVQRMAAREDANKKGSFWIAPDSNFGVQFEPAPGQHERAGHP